MNNKCLFIIISAIFLVNSVKIYASGCEASYNFDTGMVNIPCLKAGSALFDINMNQMGNLDFRASEITERNLNDANIVEIQILLEPFPIVLAFISLSNGCKSVYPVITQRIEGHNIFINIKEQSPKDMICTMALSTQVKMFSFRLLQEGSYTVNINGMTQTFIAPEGGWLIF